MNMNWFPWKIVRRDHWLQTKRVAAERTNIAYIVLAFKLAVGFGSTTLELDAESRCWFIRWQFRDYMQERVFLSESVIVWGDPVGIGTDWGNEFKEKYRRACGETKQQNKQNEPGEQD